MVDRERHRGTGANVEEWRSASVFQPLAISISELRLWCLSFMARTYATVYTAPIGDVPYE